MLGGFDKLKSKSISCENKRLRVFRSDPFDYQSIVEAMKGCSGLFYTFEPPQDQPSYDVSIFCLLMYVFFNY